MQIPRVKHRPFGCTGGSEGMQAAYRTASQVSGEGTRMVSTLQTATASSGETLLGLATEWRSPPEARRARCDGLRNGY